MAAPVPSFFTLPMAETVPINSATAPRKPIAAQIKSVPGGEHAADGKNLVWRINRFSHRLLPPNFSYAVAPIRIRFGFANYLWRQVYCRHHPGSAAIFERQRIAPD